MNLDAELTASQAARAMGVSRQLVHYWVKAGRLHPVPDTGTTKRFRLRDVQLAERATRNSGCSTRRLYICPK